MERDRLCNLAYLILLFLIGAQQWQLVGKIADLQAEIAALSTLHPADLAPLPPIGDITTTAAGNTVMVNTDAALPASPRTVEQVASYLGVTPDTVRGSYIPMWIEAGKMSPEDRVKNRWIIPETFVPYRPR
jgi:hypothetical protein